MDSLFQSIEISAMNGARAFQTYLLTIAPVTHEERKESITAINTVAKSIGWETEYDKQLGSTIVKGAFVPKEVKNEEK